MRFTRRMCTSAFSQALALVTAMRAIAFHALASRGRRIAVGVLVAVPAMLIAPLAVLPAAPAAAATAATTPSAPTGSNLPPNNAGMTTSPVSSVAGSTSQPPSAADQAVTDAKAQAKSSGQRVHMDGRDDERTVTYANPNGTVTTELSPGPRQVLRQGKWTPLDGTLHAANGKVGPAVTEAPVDLSGGSTSAGSVANVTTPGGPVGLGWLAGLPAPTLSGDTATYSNVLPNINLQVTVRPKGYEVSAVLTAAPKTGTTLRLPVQLPAGMSITQRPDGGLTIADASGQPQAVISPIVMWDAAHDPSKFGYDGVRPVDVKLAPAPGRLQLRWRAGS